MRHSAIPETGLAGHLLVAHPSLQDPNFHKSVVFIAAHEAVEGSFGLILNRPSGKTVGDLVVNQGGQGVHALGTLGRVPVYLGGPVSATELMFVSFKWHMETDHWQCQHHLGLEEAQEALQADHTVLRAYVGYSGWTGGQLEVELSSNAWLVTKARQSVLESQRSPGLWRDLMNSFGPYYRLMASAPADPSRN